MNWILGAFLVGGLVAILIASDAAAITPIAQEAVPPGTWELQEIVEADGTTVIPANPAAYSMLFVPGGRSVSIPGTPEDPIDRPDGRIDLQLDCNGGSANYRLSGERLTITELVSTDMGCMQPSLAAELADHLLTVTSYALEEDSLTLFVEGGGRLRFSPAPALNEAAE